MKANRFYELQTWAETTDKRELRETLTFVEELMDIVAEYERPSPCRTTTCRPCAVMRRWRGEV